MMRDVRTLGGLLEARAAVVPDRPFVTFESGSVTFGEIDRAANRVANALAGLGLQPGDRAAAMLSNRPEYLATWFGMTKAGVIEVPLNTGLRGDLLAYMLAHSGAKLLVIEERWVDRLESWLSTTPGDNPGDLVDDTPTGVQQPGERPVDEIPASAQICSLTCGNVHFWVSDRQLCLSGLNPLCVSSESGDGRGSSNPSDLRLSR